jgi:hypothetical protein
MPEFLAERYQPGIEAESLRADAHRLAAAVAAMRREGASIEFLDLTFVPTDEGAFARFASSSEALVAIAHERAAVPVERIVETRRISID